MGRPSRCRTSMRQTSRVQGTDWGQTLYYTAIWPDGFRKTTSIFTQSSRISEKTVCKGSLRIHQHKLFRSNLRLVTALTQTIVMWRYPNNTCRFPVFFITFLVHLSSSKQREVKTKFRKWRIYLKSVTTAPPPLMFKFHTRPTLSKSANSLFGCCLFADDSPLTHICTTSLPALQQTCYETHRRWSTLSRYFFDSVMVLFKMTCHETGVQKWTTCRIHSRISAINSSQWPSFLWWVSVFMQLHARSCEHSLIATRSAFWYSFVNEKGGTRMWTGLIWLRIWILGIWWYVCRTVGWRSGKATDLHSEGFPWLSQDGSNKRRDTPSTPPRPHPLKSFPVHRLLPTHRSIL
jgi:hypothetical protein